MSGHYVEVLKIMGIISLTTGGFALLGLGMELFAHSPAGLILVAGSLG